MAFWNRKIKVKDPSIGELPITKKELAILSEFYRLPPEDMEGTIRSFNADMEEIRTARNEYQRIGKLLSRALVERNMGRELESGLERRDILEQRERKKSERQDDAERLLRGFSDTLFGKSESKKSPKVLVREETVAKNNVANKAKRGFEICTFILKRSPKSKFATRLRNILEFITV